VARVIEKRAPNTTIAQYQGDKPDFLLWALKTRRKVCLTYNWGERYGKGSVTWSIVTI